MASQYGLLNDQRELLLSVHYDVPEHADGAYAWARVRLAAEWDLLSTAGWRRCGADSPACSPSGSFPS